MKLPSLNPFRRKKRNTLPKDFAMLLQTADLEALKKVFDNCEVDAVGEHYKQTAFAFDDCPHELAKWLIEQGADIQKTDAYDYTPLHRRAGSRSGNIKSLLELGADVNATGLSIGTPLHRAVGSFVSENATILLEYGASVDALNRNGWTPLEFCLQRCNNIDIGRAVEVSKVLLSNGAQITPRIQELVIGIGKQFEFHRANFNPEYVEDTSNALNELYRIYAVEPVAKRVLHDGQTPITVKSEKWQEQHQELWELLVPGSGAAQTMQGEVIRIAGRISREIENNGGGNWDKDYSNMADSFCVFVKHGQPLSVEESNELEILVKEIKQFDGDVYRLTELGVKWVLKNPLPIKLPEVKYKR